MTIVTEELIEKLEERKNSIGLVGTRLNVVETRGNELAAHITTDWKEIEVSYGKEVNLVPDKETEIYAASRKIEDPILKFGLDIVDHETGHRENPVGEKLGCPYDEETHAEIKDAVFRGLQGLKKESLESYVTNAFEDILDNINCRRHTDFAGQTLFWNNQGITKSEKEKYSPFYEAFVKINLLLGGKLSDISLLKRFFANSKEVRNASQVFMQDFKRYSEEESLVNLHEKQGFYRIFTPQDLERRTKIWTDLGYSFAVNVGKLLKEMPRERMFGSCEGDENSERQNPFDVELRMPENRQRIAYKRYVNGKSPLSFLDINQQLYDLYKRISRDIPVEVSHYSESQSMPLVGFGRRFIGDNETKFKFKGIGVKENGEIGIKTSKHYLEHPVSYKIHHHRFPKFKLALIDRSGSMAYNENNESSDGEKPINIGSTSFIPWGDKSKYHFALKGYFGIDNFFERQGISGYIENSVLGFSGESVIRGRSEKVAKSLLVQPSGSYTSLDITGLEKELEEDSLVLSISDGQFSINNKEKERLEKKLQSCDYVHIQVGTQSSFSSYLEGIGIPVILVSGDDDLARAMVSFVSNHYRNVYRVKK